VYVIIAAIAVAAVLFIVLRGGSSTPSPGGEVTSPGGEVTTPSGLKYVDEVVGTGASPKQGQNVTVHYTGTLENGTKFDSSVDRGQPYSFRIGTRAVIQGWDEGIMTMKVGGKRRLIVPANLAYGAAGRPGIPPNATLLFEVELLGVS
jgi:FKBP-type peptidyl-prolyl cis-trans isomerase FkpA